MHVRVLHRLSRVASRSVSGASRSYASCQESFPNFTNQDVGKLYEIKKEHYDQLNLNKNLPSTMKKQTATIGECVTMIRDPIVEVCTLMSYTRPSLPSLRLVLWGRFGTGKTLTLNQACHVAVAKSWVVVHLRSAMELTRRVDEVEMSTVVPGRINDPARAVVILNEFKLHNAHVWTMLSKLKTTRAYEWTKKERTEEGKSITEIVEMGLSAPFLASDCLGGLFRELRIHANAGDFKMLVSIDDANSLWGKTLVKRADRTYAAPSDLTLVQHYRRLLEDDWSNGTILLVADKKENSDARDKVTVPRDTPLECFGVEGFMAVEPLVPIETSLYSEQEVKAMHEYFVEKNWLSTKAAQSEEGFLQLKHIAAYNPYYFERLCAFV